MSKVLRTETLEEHEYKFRISKFTKDSLWSKEFVIFQWFIHLEGAKEIKEKLIIDMITSELKFVRVTKDRINSLESKKTVQYLEESSFDYYSMLNYPFICKRRSVQSEYQLDKFIFSNNQCESLIECEGDLEDFRIFCRENAIDLGEDVSSDSRYKNCNMAIPFEEKHVKILEAFKRI